MSFPFIVAAIAVLLHQNVATAKSKTIASYHCPHMSRHLEIWDKTPLGFQRRYRDPTDTHVFARLPDRCHLITERMEQLVKPHNQLSLLQREDRSVAQRGNSKRLPLIPYPASVQVIKGDDGFSINKKTLLKYENVDRKADQRTDLAVRHLLDHIENKVTGEGGDDLHRSVRHLLDHIENKVTGEGGDDLHREIILSLDPSMPHKEGYKLEITSDKVRLSAKDPAGLLYGVQTFRQLTPDSMEVPASVIEDAPRFGWRGLHLDVSRHFFPADDVKKLLDTMVAFKLNHFHWHLTDDQGWRIPIEGYPALIELGAENSDGVNQSYTLDQIKDVIQYAAARNIQVLPEVDVPGHAAAAISAYHFLGNTDIPDWSPPTRPSTTFGVHPYTISPKPKSFEFLRKVFDTIADIFPSEFVHIGGDEAPQDQWDMSPTASSLLERDGGRPVQAVFNEDVGKILKDKKKTVVGWDETQHIGGLPDDAVVMAWRSSDELRRAVTSGKRAVQADQASYYFDHYQAHDGEPKAIGGYLPLEQVYNNDPLPPGLSKEEESLVLGGQAQLWSEYFPTWHQVEYMAHPRSLALAERLWSPNEEIKGFNEFKDRLQVRLKDLDAMGVTYRKLQKTG